MRSNQMHSFPRCVGFVLLWFQQIPVSVHRLCKTSRFPQTIDFLSSVVVSAQNTFLITLHETPRFPQTEDFFVSCNLSRCMFHVFFVCVCVVFVFVWGGGIFSQKRRDHKIKTFSRALQMDNSNIQSFIMFLNSKTFQRKVLSGATQVPTTGVLFLSMPKTRSKSVRVCATEMHDSDSDSLFTESYNLSLIHI